MIRVFLSILLSGLVQVLLLGGMSILFSSRMIEESLSHQSAGRMKLLGSRMNNSLQEYRELLSRLSKDQVLNGMLFAPEHPGKEALSAMYQRLYKELAGNLENASLHMVNMNNGRAFSTHVLPDPFNPDSTNQSISTYDKLRGDEAEFTIVDSFVNPKGERIAFSVFHTLTGENNQSGYLIADINASYLAGILDTTNAEFFTNIYLVDQVSHKYINLFREDEAGNFSSLDWRVPPGESGSLKENETLVVYNPLYPRDLMLVGSLKLSTAEGSFLPLIRMIFLVSLAGLVLSSFLAFSLARMITKPVNILIEGMKRMENGDLDVRLEMTNGDELDFLIHGFNDMVGRIQELLENRIRKEKALRDAERKALQSQINPHFLYNTLNTVKSLSKLHGIQEITTIITQLGKLLRNTMNSQKELVGIEESLQLIEGYLQIQKIRLGRNFNWTIRMEDRCKGIWIPRLLIQPIVENAVIHGAGNVTGEKRIEITVEGAPPIITVSDNGHGIEEEVWSSALKSSDNIGLYNVNKRLKLYYRENKGLTYVRNNGRSIVTMQLGIIKKEYQDA